MEILLCMKGHYDHSLFIPSTWLATRINEAFDIWLLLRDGMTFKIHEERSGVLGAMQVFFFFFESIAYWHFGPSVYEIDQVRDDRDRKKLGVYFTIPPASAYHF